MLDLQKFLSESIKILGITSRGTSVIILDDINVDVLKKLLLLHEDWISHDMSLIL